MTVYGADSFDRANSTTSLGTAETGGAWTAHVGTWGILSNKAYLPTGTNDFHNAASLSIAQADVTVSADVTLSATSNRAYAGILLRFADANNWLRVYLGKIAGTDHILIQQFVAAAYTALAEVTSAGLTNGSTYNLKAVLAGTTIAVYLDDVQKIAPTSFNAALTTQKYGVNIYKSATTYDDGASVLNNFLVTDNIFTGRPNPLLNANIYRM